MSGGGCLERAGRIGELPVFRDRSTFPSLCIYARGARELSGIRHNIDI